MKTTRDFKRFIMETFTGIYILTNIVPLHNITYASSENIVAPLKTVAKLDCRFQDFEDLDSNCKETLDILETSDYKKYATLNGGYNDYTRRYTVLWLASYKYGWDVGYGGHEGVDIATSKGTPVLSIADGVVVVSKSDLSWGKVVTVEHTIRGKKVYSNYAHLSQIDVSKGTKVTAGQKIGEVGSTGNSTGNHLHFQIDLDTPFHPYYPDYSSCPYSYYDITENGKCIEEERQNTIDPLLFLETKGEVLDDITVTTTTVSRSTINSSSSSVSSSSSGEDLSIFDRTVYIGYSTSDIKRVQEIFRDLGEYDGPISGDYSDIEDDIISYQLANNIISSLDEYGAGRFGPKTRTQAENDYKNFLANGGESKSSSTSVTKIENNTDIEKIERTNILTREEIEARELSNFLNSYNIDFNLSDIGGNIAIDGTETLKITIDSKYKNKAFKGNTPLDITFGIDDSKVQVFPTKIYSFTNGERTVKLTGLSEGNTTLQIKMGTEVIKTIKLRVYKSGQAIYPKSSLVYANKSVVLGEANKAIVLFKDESNKKLLNIKYGSTFSLKGVGDTEVCIKSGNLNNIVNIYKKECEDSDYVKEASFTYDDTVGGLLIFDYKATGSDAKIEVINNYDQSVLGEKTFIVKDPKGLDENYVYYNDVVSMLEENIADGIKKGYFLEDRGLTESDALSWIENTLVKLSEETVDSSMKVNIEEKLKELKNENVSKFDVITRGDFLEKAYKYLYLDNIVLDNYREYRDLENTQNKMAAIVFDDSTTWKDQFGENYFRPDYQVTRGEGAYFLNQIISKQRKLYLVNR